MPSTAAQLITRLEGIVRINVSVRDAHTESIAVVVDAEPSTSVGHFAAELARVLAPAGRAEAVPPLYLGREPLDHEQTLYAAGVRDGVDLGLGVPLPAEETAEGAVELRIVSGPGAGSIYQLPPGHYDIGSGPACRVRLSDGTPAQAARIVVRVDSTVRLTSVDSAVDGARLDGEVLSEAADWPEGSQLDVGGNLLELSSTKPARAPLTRAPDGLGLEFNRPPRFVPASSDLRFRLPTEPAKPEKRAIPLLPILLVPVAGAVVAILVTGRWSFIFLALISPLGALLTQFGGRKQNQVSYQERLKEHQVSMARVRADITSAVLMEQHNRRLSFPDPASLLRMASQPSERLWERRWGDADFLDVRVGTADVASSIVVEDPALDEHRRKTTPELIEVPVPVSIRNSGVVGVAGAHAATLASWMVAQAAVLHNPADLRVCVLTSAEGERAWSWTRWLPHAQAQSEDACLFIGTTAESVARRVGELGQVVANRLALGGKAPRGGVAGMPDILVVIENARKVRSLPGVVALLREGPAVGVYTICLEREERLLPEECGAVVVPGAGGLDVRVSGAALMTGVRPDSPRADWYEQVSRSLAPLRGVGDSEDAALPKAVRLLDILGVEPPTAEVITAGWAVSGRSTRAVLGIGYDGDFAVDLVRDGPHALIAGTTGSGKSELLQTLVAALAVANRPDEMTFVLVDYKGGSAFAECADLPHTVGLVTDLDTHLVERALISLGAELRRREHLLAVAGAKDLVDYQDKRNRGAALGPLPRLLLVIDEFASMVRELPNFVAGLVNIAQRGRSLGIHLVLATQRPSGAVTGDIRANTNLRIALRTTDTNESRDIIDAPDAGEISSSAPGRAYARLGPNALLPFQSGRVGGRRPAENAVAADVTPVSVMEVGWRELGSPIPRGIERGAGQSQGAVTDLAVLTEAVARAAESAGIGRQPSPWLPALPELVQMSELPTAGRPAPEGALPGPVGYGLVDLPAEQSREDLAFDLDRSGHLHIIGSQRTGRSQTLRTLAAALSMAHSVEDFHLYALDCGNGALNAMTSLPHCGAVVDRNQVERLGRLLDRLCAELATRQALLGGRGVADLAELRGLLPAGERPPHIMLMVDRFEVFEREFATFDNGSYMERMLRLMRDGAGVGIHLVLAGDRVLGSGRFAGTTEDKIVLRMNDRTDYSAVGLNARDVPEELPPGRGLRAQDMSEVQIAVLGPDVSGGGQALVLTVLGETLTARESGVPAHRRPMRLDVLPDRISYADARALRDPSEAAAMRPMVGVSGDTLTLVGPDLTEVPTFVVAGPPRSGRSTVLAAIARSLLEAGTGLLVLAPRRSPLRNLAGTPGVCAVITDPDVGQSDFREALRKIPEDTGVVLVDDAELMMQSEIGPDLVALARGAAGNGWGLVVGGNAEAMSLGLAGWIGQVKRNRAGLLLSPQSITEGELLGVRLSRGVIGQAPQLGRGYLHLGDGTLRTVQVPETRIEA